MRYNLYMSKNAHHASVSTMNLESALQRMYDAYVTANGDAEGFISDLAIILGHDEDIAHDVDLNAAEYIEFDE